MNKFNNKNKGFTLIELLVVIAVIGILASVITASIFSSRNKGGDGGIKREMQELRSQAEIYYLNNSNRYYVSATDNVCTNPPPTAPNKYRLDPLLTKLSNYYKPVPPIVTTFTTAQTATNFLVCHVDTNNGGYAISTKLLSPTTATYLCIDSKNNRKQNANLLPASSITCP